MAAKGTTEDRERKPRQERREGKDEIGFEPSVHEVRQPANMVKRTTVRNMMGLISVERGRGYEVGQTFLARCNGVLLLRVILTNPPDR